MKNRIQFLVFFLLVSSAVLDACGEEAKESGEPGGVPNSLQTIEAAAEDLIDFAPSGNWDKIGTDVTDIANAWKSYRPQASRDERMSQVGSSGLRRNSRV